MTNKTEDALCDDHPFEDAAPLFGGVLLARFLTGFPWPTGVTWQEPILESPPPVGLHGLDARLSGEAFPEEA